MNFLIQRLFVVDLRNEITQKRALNAEKMLQLLLFGVFCLGRIQAFTLEVPVHVKLADGSPIRGKKVKSVNETEIEAYLGIRYAQVSSRAAT